MILNHIDLIKSFGQGVVQLPNVKSSLGNCASIALIKAGIEVFGLYNLFEMGTEDGIYKITYKNSRRIYFTDEELERSNKVADFRLNESDSEKKELYKEITSYAQIAHCAIVKTAWK